ncbi:MAG: hypothetical protein AAF218_03400 [Pseudomonadota bacterium]
MTVAGKNGVIVAEIFVDCLGFGRGFDDDNGHQGRKPFGNLSLWSVYGGAECGVQGENVNAVLGEQGVDPSWITGGDFDENGLAHAGLTQDLDARSFKDRRAPIF